MDPVQQAAANTVYNTYTAGGEKQALSGPPSPMSDEITDDIVRTAAVGLPPNWEALLSEEHVPYYANTVTGEVQWEPPEK